MKQELWAQSKILEPMLKQHYPAVFNPIAPVPLAVGIHEEILAANPTVPPEALKFFLRGWTNQLFYHKAIREPGSVRLHLDGTVQAPVTEEERNHARMKIKLYWDRRARQGRLPKHQ